MGQLNSLLGQKGERRTGEKSIWKATDPDQWDIAQQTPQAQRWLRCQWNIALVFTDDCWNLPGAQVIESTERKQKEYKDLKTQRDGQFQENYTQLGYGQQQYWEMDLRGSG